MKMHRMEYFKKKTALQLLQDTHTSLIINYGTNCDWFWGPIWKWRTVK